MTSQAHGKGIVNSESHIREWVFDKLWCKEKHYQCGEKHCTLSPENICLTNNIVDKTWVKKKDCVDKNTPNKMLLKFY